MDDSGIEPLTPAGNTVDIGAFEYNDDEIFGAGFEPHPF